MCVVWGSLALSAGAWAQTNPAPLTLPVSQNWGGVAFGTMPTGFAAWNGLSGGSITTQAAAEASTPSGNASVATSTPVNGGTGGCYGYLSGGGARFAILTSSNVSNGVNQLAMAIDTTGQTNIVLTYDLINVIANVRTVGTVCQYRVGQSGAWTTLTGTGNPYVQSGGTPETVTPASIVLPAAAENQPLVQVRWAVWRGTQSGSSSCFAIDNITVTAVGSGPIVTGLALSGGPNYALDETAIATVTLNGPPDTSATINVTSGAFAAPAVVTITAPDTTGQAEVSMAHAGSYTATATAVSGCGGTAPSASFNVIGAPEAAFAATGVNSIDDSAGNANGYIDPGENGINLYLEIVNSGTANATGVTATLTSLSGTASVSNGNQGYPNIAIGNVGTNSVPFQISVSPSHVCGSTVSLQLSVTSNEGSSVIGLNLPTCPPVADQYSPPVDYYATATGTGATLKSQLHNIISKDYWNGFLSSPTHRVRSYDAAKLGLQITDNDPSNSNNIILIYTGASVPKGWDAGATWNREHSWPDSRGINGTTPAYSDMHHLRPCEPSINGSRGVKPYGLGGGYWDPDHGAPHRGRAARTIFYMTTRYNGTAPDPGLDLVLVNGMPSGNQMGDLAALLDWHYANPVDEFERHRNQAVFSNVLNPSYYQGNRNPYVDHPEYVWTIFGSGPNDSQLYVGASPQPDGSSTTVVDLGAIIVNTAMPVPQNVAINKVGSTPTTYDIILSGSAVSAAAGPRQAFISGVQSRNISAGLIASTAVAGLKTGAITIDNTDLTSAGGGTGAADGNDTVNISLAVLDHANASFNSPSDQDALTIDFGTVSAGSGVVSQPFDIHDLVQTAGFTAALDLDSVTGAGDTAVLGTDAATYSNIAAGSSHGFNATLDTASAGNYSATYTLHLSDQNIPGATATTDLTLTLLANVVPSVCTAADANCDTIITLADVDPFVARLLGMVPSGCSVCAGDLNNDGFVNGGDVQAFVNVLLTP